MNLSVISRIIWGAVIVMSIVFALVFTNYSGLISSQNTVDRVVSESSPTVESTLKLFNGINRAMEGLRGYLLIGDDKYLAMKSEAWMGFIDPAIEELDVLSENWISQEDEQKYVEAKSLLPHFKESLEEAEALAKGGDNEAAMNILLTDLTPTTQQLSTLLEDIYQQKQYC